MARGRKNKPAVEKSVDKQIDDAVELEEELDDLTGIDGVASRFRTKQGRAMKSYIARAPLPGVTKETSEKIREIVSFEYSGYTDGQIGERLGLTAGYMNVLRSRHPYAFEDARKVHLAAAAQQYHLNLYRVKAAISDAGPRAVKVLDEIMTDRENSAAVRSRAAEALLKLLGANERLGVETAVAQEYLQTVKDATEVKPEYIVDVTPEGA